MAKTTLNCQNLLKKLALELRPVDKFRWKMNRKTWDAILRQYNMADNAHPDAERNFLGLPLDLDETLPFDKIVLRWEEEVE